MSLRQHLGRAVRWCGCLAALVVVAGCGLGKSEPSRFYILEPEAAPAVTPDTAAAAITGGLADAAASPGCLTLGVGPVTLPGYLDREQMVTREDDHSVDVAEFDRWAEPLDRAFARTLAANLAARLGQASSARRCVRPVVSYPFPQGALPDLQVTMQLFRHDCQPGKDCVLDAAWVVLDARGVVQASGAGRYVQPLPETSYAAMASALSRLNTLCADEVAAAVRQAALPDR
ncbi:PqiC family protein [Megalodesulfovibrio paquesii]